MKAIKEILKFIICIKFIKHYIMYIYFIYYSVI